MIPFAKIARPGLLAGALFLGACSTPTAAPSPTLDPGTQLTAIASTVQAELTQRVALTPSATFTQEPTNTEVPPTAAVPTLPAVTDTPAAVIILTATRPAVADKGLYLGQTVADNSKMDPGKSFTMTWKMKNVGTTTWSTKYQLRFFAGNTLGAKNAVAFPKEVTPGDTVELSVNMKAPSDPGNYHSVWVLTNADGANFFPVTLDIIIGNPPTATKTSVPATAAPTATTGPTATTAPTVTPTP
ncbi:MAG TPA: NBR1-Ig-like domain-containing protein [Anaerolineaceae bacterium]|nr:NBR1-Ig-like domain-containing protein [Anaerolineaceae bacterium]